MPEPAGPTSLALIVPAYNEGGRLYASLGLITSELGASFGGGHVVVVDDASTPPVSAEQLPAGADVTVHLLRHDLNLGQGAALQTGVDFARDVLRANVFVTMDADGQHDPKDLARVASALKDADIVFGTRFSDIAPVNMPLHRRWVLLAARLFERLLTGLKLSDAHNGYRAFNHRFASVMCLKQNRMAHATEIKQAVARHRLRYAEVPVRVRYTADSIAKGQRSSGGFAILKDLLRAYLFNG
ncbi:MAG TPA: glycosyltransferase family 2 protein [Myxococcaceae bacterium]|nr:glycosyltransferase family 2 protein [Myxococcaceae bacterium]